MKKSIFIMCMAANIGLSCSSDIVIPESSEQPLELSVDIAGTDIFSSQDPACDIEYILWRNGVSGDTVRGTLPLADRLAFPVRCDAGYTGRLWVLPDGVSMDSIENNGYAFVNNATATAAVARLNASRSAKAVTFSPADANIEFLVSFDELQVGRDSGIEPQDISTRLVINGAVSSPEFHINPADTVMHDGKPYTPLFRSDIIPAENGLTNAVLHIRFEDVMLQYNYSNFPVKAGETTVLTDRFLTCDVEFNITISPDFNGDINMD